MKNQVNNKADKYAQDKEKQSGLKELGDGFSRIFKGITDTLLNTLAATYEATMTGASFLSEKLGSKDSTIIANRKSITNHHLKQTKKSVNKVGNSALDIIKGGFHTTKGAIRTVFTSGKDTIKSLREDDSENDNKKTAKKKSEKNPQQKKD